MNDFRLFGNDDTMTIDDLCTEMIGIIYERMIGMHIGSKGWYVNELKKLGMSRYEGRKLESYKKHILANLYFDKAE